MSASDFSHLRALTMGQILDRAIRLYRRNFLKFLGIAALVQIPTTLFSLLSTGAMLNGAIQTPTPENPTFDPSMMLLPLLSFAIVMFSLVWTQIGAAALIQMATDSYLGQSLGIVDAFRKIGRSWLSLIGTLLLSMLFIFLSILFFIIPCIGWLSAIPGFGIFMYASVVLFPLVTPVVVLERLAGTQAMRRAWGLARQRFWWLFGFFCLVGLFAVVITQGPTLFLNGILSTVGKGTMSPAAQTILQLLISALLGVIYYPISITCATLVYLDTRIRQEGLDLALQAAEPGSDAALVLRQTPPTSTQKLIVGTEWGYFILITVGGGILIGIVALLVAATLFPIL